jgi:thioredoxin reductase (NADPH)
VTPSSRSEAFQRAKQRNRQRVEAAKADDRLKVLLNSQVDEIRPEEVVLKLSGQKLEVSNDAIIVSAGGILPNDFLRSIGIEVETKHGTA